MCIFLFILLMFSYFFFLSIYNYFLISFIKQIFIESSRSRTEWNSRARLEPGTLQKCFYLQLLLRTALKSRTPPSCFKKFVLLNLVPVFLSVWKKLANLLWPIN